MTTHSVQAAIDKFWEFFPPVWHAVRARTHRDAIESFAITVGQFHILRRIRDGIDSVSKLAEDRHTSLPTISRAVEVLVKQGLIERQVNPSDRRNVQLSLTKEGSSLMETLFNNTREWMASSMANLSEAEIEAILIAGDALKRAFTDERNE